MKSFRITAIACLISLFNTSFSCAKDNILDPEAEDHIFCLSEVAQVGQKEISNKAYWKCRFEVAKRKGSNLGRNSQVIIDNLRLRLDMATNENYAKEEITEEAYDHKVCLNRGFVSDIEDEKELEDYYKCRMQVSRDRSVNIPFEYGSYDSPEFLDSDNDIESYMSKRTLQLDSFNFCHKYIKSQITFGNCVNTYLSYEQCLVDAPNQIVNREIDNIVFCKKESIEQFPDEMALYKEDSNYAGPKFSKKETDELRDAFYKKCLEDRDDKSIDYTLEVIENCESKLKTWE